jgi:branched-chain amino acid transport system ATP-binding protein
MQLGRPVSGTVTFASINPAARPPHKIAELDIAHVPEGRQVFPEMTVREM